ncbi:UPAR/Ly6 domain-containing protein bero-like [Musca autumnalis]|uniref:UPAR/Ly6 domain-containing protein bero-like n=1 Tax=Musca autumnalis TaxID=221902 RepID=UPI003CEC6C7D
MSATKYLLIFAVIVALTSSALAVRCYQCTSLQNPKCGEKFESDDSLKTDCNRVNAPFYLLPLLNGRSVNATGCMKQTLESTLGGGKHVIRSCYFGDISHTETGCKTDPTNFGIKQLSCDVCKDNLCNTSPSMTPFAAGLFVFFGLARILS